MFSSARLIAAFASLHSLVQVIKNRVELTVDDGEVMLINIADQVRNMTAFLFDIKL